MKSTVIGQRAEAAVANQLKDTGYKIVARNWKTKVCEIDIITDKNRVIYFVEVKYRSSDGSGEGLDYITDKKLNQMTFASKIWCHENNWEGDCRLLVAEVSGSNFENINIVEVDN